MGMRGTGDWATNQVPESWAQYILYEKPNGMASMFAMQSMFREETVDSHTHHWWTKTLPTQAVDVTAGAALYIDEGLATAYVYASHLASHGTVEKMIYAKVPVAFAQECRAGNKIIMRDSDQLTVDVVGRITNVIYDGANSKLAIKLLETDDNHASSSTYNLATVDRLLLVGNVVPEGSLPPDAIGYDPVEYTNYVEEFRDTLDITWIAQATTLRTGDAYKEAKRECSELHSIGIEKTGFWGRKYSGIGENGKPLRTTQGMIPFTIENAPSNVVDFYTDTDTAFSGKTWLQAGKKFMDKYLAQLFAYLPGEAFGWCGAQALLALNELAEAYGQIQLKVRQVSYGIMVTEWITPFGTLYLKTHPLFSHETTTSRLLVIYHPKNVRFAYLVGGGKSFRTKFETNMQIPGQHSQVDGYYTAGMWKFYFPNQFMIMRNLGLDQA